MLLERCLHYVYDCSLAGIFSILSHSISGKGKFHYMVTRSLPSSRSRFLNSIRYAVKLRTVEILACSDFRTEASRTIQWIVDALDMDQPIDSHQWRLDAPNSERVHGDSHRAGQSRDRSIFSPLEVANRETKTRKAGRQTTNKDAGSSEQTRMADPAWPRFKITRARSSNAYHTARPARLYPKRSRSSSLGVEFTEGVCLRTQLQTPRN